MCRIDLEGISMDSRKRAAGILEDARIPVRLKLAALWISLMFLYAYGDIFGFLRRDVLDGVRAGTVGGFQINQVFLLAVSIYILIASLMVFLTLVLRPDVSRWANIVISLAYLVTIVLSAIGETWGYYIVLSIAESALALLIAWYAWRWPRARVTT
jgi:Family of unknown function (DUF6326)